MIQKGSRSLITKLNWHFYDMVKIRLFMINYVNVLPHVNLYYETKVSGESCKFGYNY